MGKTLIITEKPSVAREFATILGVRGNNDGYIENDNYVITWCVGHLVTMCYPEAYDESYKEWKEEDLPFLPKTYKYYVPSNVKKQYNVVKTMLYRNDISECLWAGDSGREGQVIEENIRRFCGVRDGLIEKRVWIDSQTKDEILRGIREAKPMSDYDNLGDAGIMRAIEDYAIGINFSRIMSIKYGGMLNRAAANKKYHPLATGRVMTCVLGMVVNREREIRNFTETTFYKIIGNFGDGIKGEWKAIDDSEYIESTALYKNIGFLSKDKAEEFINSLSGIPANVTKAERTTEKKKAPLLFNLAELQNECTKQLSISPDKTLEIAQSLYEKKLTTYPRTDARVLTTAVANEIDKNLKGLVKFDDGDIAQKILDEDWHSKIAKSVYTNDSKVTDHYAIIPTGEGSTDGLSTLEEAVFALIKERFFSIFYPPAEYSKTLIHIKVGKETFVVTEKVLVKKGYLEILSNSKDTSSGSPTLLSLKEGDTLNVNEYSISEGKTKPPKRYTSGSMILAMENAGNLIEDEDLRAQIKGAGIGTSATRADIIKKLIENHQHLNLNKKTQVLTPTPFGEMMYELVQLTVPDLLVPEMTAEWEKGLEEIANGVTDVNDYRQKVEQFVREKVEEMIAKNCSQPLSEAIKPFSQEGAVVNVHELKGKCPNCQSPMLAVPKGYMCSKYSKTDEGCKFYIGNMLGVRIPEDAVETLLETGKSPVIKGFKSSKTKNTFDAHVVLTKDDNGQSNLSFEFPSNETEYTCPDCGKPIIKSNFGYSCSGYKKDDENSCKFSIPFTIAKKKISERDIKQLFEKGETDTIKGFKGKSGKSFDAVLKLVKEDNHSKVQFVFDNSVTETEYTCPNCGKPLIKSSRGYSCSGYKKDEPNSCNFWIGKIAEKVLTDKQVEALITEGVTETISGFKSKKGSTFSAKLQLVEKEGKYKVEFLFDNQQEDEETNINCPECNNKLIKSKYTYHCSCGFKISNNIAKHYFSENEMEELIENKRLNNVSGLVSKAGKKFTANVIFDGVKLSFNFDD